jgi:RNA polymerase sigma-70 factor (ECF subfamily)
MKKGEFGYESFDLFKKGHRQIFDHFYEHFGEWIILSLRKIADKDFLREDIINLALIKAWNHRETFEDIAHLKSWLYCVVRNDVISILRSQTSEKKKIDGFRYLSKTLDQTTTTEEDHTRLHERLSRSINDLSPLNRQIIELAFMEEKSNQEIALQLNLTLNAVVARKSRALNFLRLQMLGPGFG